MKNNETLKKAILLNIFILILYFATSFLDIGISYADGHGVLTNIIFIALSLIFLAYLRNHISYKRQRRPLIVVAIFMVLFMTFRAFKYNSFNNIDIVARHLWYLYYLPTLFIPYFLLFSCYIYIRNKKVVIISSIITFIITTILFLLVITNDLHQLVFKFNDDFLNWDSDYQRGVVYYLIVAWVSITLITTFIILFFQTTIVVGKKYSWLSLIPLILGSVWLALDIFHLIPHINDMKITNEFPETLCFMIAGYILSLIKLGLIASNNSYDEFFSNATQPVFILNKNKEIIYQSRGFYDLHKEDIPPINQKIIIGDNIISNVSIHGGSTVYVQDIKEINRAKKELEEIKENLKEEERLNELIIKGKEEEITTQEKNNLYDAISKETHEESNLISDLVSEVEKDFSLFDKNMSLVLFYSAYIKRLANFKLLESENKKINFQELYLAIAETSRYLEKNNIKVDLINNVYEREMEGYYLSSTYTLLIKLIEKNIDHIHHILISFKSENDVILKLVLEGDDINANEMNNPYIKLIITKEDEAYYISFVKKGSQNDEIN
ncbi:MAG: hypothetical protein IJ186_04610 [Bacilli bacterium]|nr:hypothetical protein [Bacilli bacterium]